MEISLALGGGGAKGNAHIGVLKVLEQQGFQIKAISGTSMGGLVGAVYLAGLSPDEIEDFFAKTDQRKLFGHGDDEEPSLLGFKGGKQLLGELLGDKRFEDLPIPFAVTAVDINSGKEVIIKSGSLADAILATTALPGIFPARPYRDMLLVDGGIINPVPVDLARSLAPKYPVAAVSLSKLPQEKVEGIAPELAQVMPVLKRVSRLRLTQAFNTFVRSYDISGRLLTELRLDIEKPDIIIRPDVHHILPLGIVDVKETVKLGEQAALEALSELEAVTKWPSRISKWFKNKEGHYANYRISK